MTDDFSFGGNGSPITPDQWADLMRSSRILAQDVVPGQRLLKTVWLGFVDVSLPDSRRFGTALLDEHGQFLAELALYEGREQAETGHARLLDELSETPQERP